MAYATTAGLEKTLDTVDAWFIGRFDIYYTEEFAGSLKKEILKTISPDIGTAHRDEISDYFGRENMLALVRGYFSVRYAAAQEMLDCFRKAGSMKPNQDDRRLSFDLLQACTGITELVGRLAEKSALSPQMIEEAFASIYKSPEEFYTSFSMNGIKLSDAGADAGDAAGAIMPRDTQFNGEKVKCTQELCLSMQQYADLLNGEAARARNEYMPKVFSHVLMDIYHTA